MEVENVGEDNGIALDTPELPMLLLPPKVLLLTASILPSCRNQSLTLLLAALTSSCH